MDNSVAYNGIEVAVHNCYEASFNAGWWHDPVTNECLIDNQYVNVTKLCMIHSEISEAMEGMRKNLMDDKLPHRKMVEVELADALIRIFDFAGANDLDLAGAYVEKFNYNMKRPDHKPENRIKDNGKKF